MDSLALRKEIDALILDDTTVPSEALVSHATEYGWLNASQTNLANTVVWNTDTRRNRWVMLEVQCLLIERGLQEIGHLFSESERLHVDSVVAERWKEIQKFRRAYRDLHLRRV